jgi:hypothetical protein
VAREGVGNEQGILSGRTVMTNKERVITSLRHKRPDKIPYEVSFTGKSENVAAMIEVLNDH